MFMVDQVKGLRRDDVKTRTSIVWEEEEEKKEEEEKEEEEEEEEEKEEEEKEEEEENATETEHQRPAEDIKDQLGTSRTSWGDIKDQLHGDTKDQLGGHQGPAGGTSRTSWGDIKDHLGTSRTSWGHQQPAGGTSRTSWGDNKDQLHGDIKDTNSLQNSIALQLQKKRSSPLNLRMRKERWEN
ncbi:hypothetical protein Pcinc_021397 [Petrolisthes cinctipes]|uniref:Uncharacterized protein n=1 Tax=Petrolisthes cinctipes TaxID=88211 RepID=A0AAE1KIE9_PETCI|nr:hypothetical protein Pcinc_021397 [Petrolisthes cinctipes]